MTLTIAQATARLQDATQELEAANAAYATAYARLDEIIEAGIEDERYSQAVDAQLEAQSRMQAADSLYREAKRLHYIATQDAKR